MTQNDSIQFNVLDNVSPNDLAFATLVLLRRTILSHTLVAQATVLLGRTLGTALDNLNLAGSRTGNWKCSGNLASKHKWLVAIIGKDDASGLVNVLFLREVLPELNQGGKVLFRFKRLLLVRHARGTRQSPGHGVAELEALHTFAFALADNHQLTLPVWAIMAL